ncbi:MAG: hypothetical protein AAF639_01730 [Chloroflexota bacterium]
MHTKRHTQKSGHPTFMDGEFYLPEWLPSDLHLETMLWDTSQIEGMDMYGDILKEIGVRVERGELTASDAADETIERLSNTFGTQLIIE